MNPEELARLLRERRLAQNIIDPETGETSRRVFGEGEEAEARALLETHGRDFAILSDAEQAGIANEQQIGREQESLRRNLGELPTQALGLSQGVANSLTLGQYANILERITGNPDVGRRAEALRRSAGGAMIGGEILGDVAAAAVTGGSTSLARGAMAGPAGLAQATANRMTGSLMRRAAARGIARGATTRRFLATLGARATGTVAAGELDIAGRALSEYAITGEPIDAEGLFVGGLMVAGLGLGLEGAHALYRGARAGGRGLTRAQQDQVATLQRSGIVDDVNLREAGAFETPAPRAESSLGPRADEVSAFVAGVDPVSGRADIERMRANPASHNQGLRQRRVREAGTRFNALMEGMDEDLGDALSPVRRQEFLEDLGRRAGYGDLGPAEQAAATRMRETLEGVVRTTDEAFAALPEGTRHSDQLAQVRDRLSEIVGDAGANPFVGEGSIARQIDRFVDFAGQVHAGRTDSPLVRNEIRRAVEGAIIATSTAPGVDPVALSRIQGAQRASLSLRNDSVFMQRLVAHGGAGRPRVNTRNLQNAFDTDAVSALDVFPREETREFLRALDDAAAAAESINPGNARASAMRAEIQSVANEMRDLAHLMEATASVQMLDRVGAKTGGAMSGVGVPGPLLGGALGAAAFGPVGGAVGFLAGLGVQALAKPVQVHSKMAGIRSLFRMGDSRAAASFGRLRTAAFGGNRVRTPLGSGVRSTPLRREVPRLVAKLQDYESAGDEYLEIRRQLRETVGNPAFLEQHIGDLTGPLASIDPGLADNAAMTFVRGAMYLHESLPPDQSVSDPYAALRRSRPSTADIRALSQRLHVVQDPLAAVDLAASGRLTAAHAEALRSVYPAMYAALAGHVSEMIASASELPPYHMRQQLNLLAGVETDPTLDPAFIARMQQRSAQTPQQQQASFGGRASMTAASRVSDGLTTQTQRVTVGM